MGDVDNSSVVSDNAPAFDSGNPTPTVGSTEDATAPNFSVLAGAPSSDMSSVLGGETPPPPPPPVAPGPTPAAAPAAPVTPAQPGAQPPQKPPTMWQQILSGALVGMSGGVGAKNFGQGVAGGAKAEIDYNQQQTENKMKQQQLQMESVKAADSHIAALDEHRRAEQLNDLGKVEYKQKSAEYQNYLQENFGIEPDVSFNDTTAAANGGMATLAQQNGGTVPPVSTVHQPSPDGEHGQVAAYSPSQEKMRQNASGFRSLVNTQRAIQGLPPVDDATYNSMGFKGQRDAANAAIDFLKPQVKFTLDKNSPDYLPNVLASKQQQLQNYQSHNDVNGKPDANAATVNQLQAQVDFLNKAWDNGNAMENKAQADTIAATAPAKAAAAAQAKTAEVNAEAATPTGQLNATAKRVEIAKNQEELQEKRDDNLVAFDPTYQNADGTKGANRMMSRGEAEQNGLKGYKVDATTVNSNVAGFNDVQTKLNLLHDISTDPNRMKNVQPAIAAAMLKHDKGLEVGAFGTHFDTSQINAHLYQEDVAAANQDTRDFVAAYANAHEAITQLPRLQTFGKSSRMTQQQMEAAQNLIPVPGDDSNLAETKFHNLASTMAPLRKQLPTGPGLELNPTYEDPNYVPSPKFTPKSAPNNDIYGFKSKPAPAVVSEAPNAGVGYIWDAVQGILVPKTGAK